MEELLILAVLFMFGGNDDDKDDEKTSTKNGTKGPDDWGYDYAEWEKVHNGFARKLAWRVYRNKTMDGEFELAFKNPDGLHSEGGFETADAAKERGKQLGEAPGD